MKRRLFKTFVSLLLSIAMVFTTINLQGPIKAFADDPVATDFVAASYVEQDEDETYHIDDSFDNPSFGTWGYDGCRYAFRFIPAAGDSKPLGIDDITAIKVDGVDYSSDDFSYEKLGTVSYNGEDYDVINFNFAKRSVVSLTFSVEENTYDYEITVTPSGAMFYLTNSNDEAASLADGDRLYGINELTSGKIYFVTEPWNRVASFEILDCESESVIASGDLSNFVVVSYPVGDSTTDTLVYEITLKESADYDSYIILAHVENYNDDGNWYTDDWARGVKIANHVAVSGDLAFAFDIYSDDLAECSFINKTKINTATDLPMYPAILDDDLNPVSVPLLNDQNGLSSDYKIYFTPAGGTRAAATLSFSNDYYGVIEKTQLVIVKDKELSGWVYLTACYEGLIEIVYKEGTSEEKQITITSRADGNIHVTAYKDASYEHTTMLYEITADEEDRSFKIIPGSNVKSFSIAISSYYGYGSYDGYRDNGLFTAKKSGTDVTNDLVFLPALDDSNNYEWENVGINDVSGEHFTDTVILTAKSCATTSSSVCIKYITQDDKVGYRMLGISCSNNSANRGNNMVCISTTANPAFDCYAISVEEYYAQGVDWFIDAPLYYASASSFAEAIEIMTTEMAKPDSPIKDCNYLSMSLALQNRGDETIAALASSEQFISTPDNIKGVLFVCGSMGYMCDVKNNYASINSGNDVSNVWIKKSHPAYGTYGTSEIEYFLYDETTAAYYMLECDFSTGDISVKSDTPYHGEVVNSEKVLAENVNGKKYIEPDDYYTEFELPVIHVDATTEVRLYGKFAKSENGAPSVFINIPDDGSITPVINEKAYTPSDMGNTYNEHFEINHWDWVLNTISSDYVVKIGKLEAKTEFSGTGDVTNAYSEIDADALFAQLDSSMSAEDKAKVASGKNVTAELDVASVADTSSTELATATAGYDTDSVQYMDIDLKYYVGFEDGAAETSIAETDTPVEITLALADDVASDGATYTVLREHEGTVEELTATYDAATGTVSFNTDKFSSYAILVSNLVTNYTVSFNVAGGSAVASITVSKGGTASSLPTTSKNGYTFAGWFTDEACTIAFTTSTVVNGSITVYAKWTPVSSGGNNNNSGNSNSSNSSNNSNNNSNNSNNETIVETVPVIYTIVPGDTIKKIAKRVGLTVAQLKKLNPHIKNINKIKVGQTIIIGTEDKIVGNDTDNGTNSSSTKLYAIKKNDTFAKIAKKYGMSVSQLKKLNPQIKNINRIYAGNIIFISK